MAKRQATDTDGGSTEELLIDDRVKAKVKYDKMLGSLIKTSLHKCQRMKSYAEVLTAAIDTAKTDLDGYIESEEEARLVLLDREATINRQEETLARLRARQLEVVEELDAANKERHNLRYEVRMAKEKEEARDERDRVNAAKVVTTMRCDGCADLHTWYGKKITLVHNEYKQKLDVIIG